MRNDVVRPIVRGFFERLDAGESWRTDPAEIPAGNYTDPDHLATERDLLRRTPRVVALSGDLPEPGSFVRRDGYEIPLVIVRGDDGVARALANVCAHRGAEVVGDDRGCQRRFTCPYHGWSYDRSGTLVGLPDRSAFPGVTTPGPGLRELPTFEEHGVIWAVLDADADPAPPDLGAFADDLDGYDTAGHQHWRSHRFELDLNWKLVIDTFLEPYHFAVLHRDTVGPLFLPNLCHAERQGPHLREVLPRRTLDQLRDQPEEVWDLVPHSAIVYVLFPDTVFVMQLDHLETWRVVPHPTDPGRSVCDLDFYLPELPTTEKAERHWERNWQLTIDTVIEEDFQAMAGVQRGLASGVLDHLRVGANEPALGLYHGALASELARAE